MHKSSHAYDHMKRMCAFLKHTNRWQYTQAQARACDMHTPTEYTHTHRAHPRGSSPSSTESPHGPRAGSNASLSVGARTASCINLGSYVGVAGTVWHTFGDLCKMQMNASMHWQEYFTVDVASTNSCGLCAFRLSEVGPVMDATLQ